MKYQPTAFVILAALALAACQKLPGPCVTVTDDSWQSYYNPRLGTLNIRNGFNACNIEVTGEPLSGVLAVGSDQANSVRFVGNGWDKFFMVSGQSVNAVRSEGSNKVRFTHAGASLVFNTNGDLLANEHTGAARCSYKDLVCKDNGVYLYNMKRFNAIYPRDAARYNGKIVVADTFGHLIRVYDESTGALLKAIDSYYPNSVQLVDGGKNAIVTEEHANRVVKVDLATGEKEILYGCGIGIYSDTTATARDFALNEHKYERADGKTQCAGRLYSPNYAKLYEDGSLLIADTDNHRVIVVKGGVVVTEIKNLNNATSAVVLGKTEAR